VTPAFFATLRDEPRTLCTWIYALTEVLAVATFPLLAGLALTAPDAVPLLLGPQWIAAVVPLQILALYGMWDILVQLISRSLTAVGEARFMARIGLSLVLVMPLAFIVGSRWGIEGVAIAWVLANPAVRFRIILEARRRLGLSLRRWAAAIWPAASSTLLMALAVWAVGQYETGQPPLERLVSQIASGALVFAGALLIFHRPRVRTWQSAIGRLRAADGIARADAEAAA
jgi:teichuronic acid exporter